MDNNKLVVSVAYLPPVQYLSAIVHAHDIIFEYQETYYKQSYRNRCVIYGGNGPVVLTIPVIKVNGNRTKTKDVQIDNQKKWQSLHWKTIESAYRSSPFFEFYKDELHHFYKQEYNSLFKFNMELLEVILDQLDLKVNIYKSSAFEKEYPSDICDMRELIHPKKDYRLYDKGFKPLKYFQVFDDRFGFKPNLSIIDLIFNKGPDTKNVLLASRI